MRKHIFCIVMTVMLLLACTFAVQAAEENKTPVSIPGLTYDHSMELSFAEEFFVDYYQDGYALITIREEGQYLVVPEGKDVPENLDSNITVLRQPMENI